MHPAMRLTALTTCLCAPSAMAEDEFGMRLPASLRLFGWLEMELARSFASVGMKRAFGECELGYGGLRSMAHKLEEQMLVGYEWRPIWLIPAVMNSGFGTTGRPGMTLPIQIEPSPYPTSARNASGVSTSSAIAGSSSGTSATASPASSSRRLAP